MRALLPLLVACLALSLAARGLTARHFPHPDRIRYDAQGLYIEGKPVFIYSGAFHYFRCPKELWQDRFQTIKNAGFNAVETYVPWNWHELKPPKRSDDFSQMNLRDLDDWLKLAEEFGFYVIIRPGALHLLGVGRGRAASVAGRREARESDPRALVPER